MTHTTLFVDMDDVVADFSKATLEIIGYLMPEQGREKYPTQDWQKLLAHPRVYRNLDKCKWADDLIDVCSSVAKKNNWGIKFLTAIPRDNDFPWAFYDKVEWAKEYYPNIPVWFGPYSKDKHLHCKPGDILVDDRYRNIERWTEVGGIGILCKNAESAIQNLKLF